MDGNRTIAETLYDRDFAAWAAEQGRIMRAGDHDRVDWPNVIEEIETLGRAERSALRSAIALILEHLIKRDHGLNDDPKRGWTLTIKAQRRNALRKLKENPGFRTGLSALILDEYDDARAMALDSFELHEEARLDHYRAAIPQSCPYTQSDVLG